MPEAPIYQCPCGAAIRLPAERANRQLRCPQCQKGIALTAAAQPLETKRLQPGEAKALCQVCQTEIGPDDDYVSCPSCRQAQHQECWSEVGGCGTYGCTEAPALEKNAAGVQAPLTAWGDTKRCPACGEEVKSIAVKCRYCDTEFGTVDPISLADLRKKAQRDEKLKGLKQSTIALFIVSLIGCAAPLLAIIALAVLLPRREELKTAGPLFVVMGYASIVISVLYTFLFGIFVLIEMS